MKKNQTKKPSWLRKYIYKHSHAFLQSLKSFGKSPWGTLLTVAVIGIALSLPASLYVFLQNARSAIGGIKDNTQISLYLKLSVDETSIQSLLNQLRTDNNIASVEYISPADGLKMLQAQEGMTDVIAQLNNNPLPGVMVVHPSESLTSPQAINELLGQLQSLPQVDIAQLDMAWVKKLYAYLNLGEAAVIALGLLLGLGVLLIVGNTMRLNIQNFRSEIQLIKMVGGTNSFIRRPFLYNGIFYGLTGALLAYALIAFLVYFLNVPVLRLASLYNSGFHLQNLNIYATLLLFFSGAMLGLLGSWMAVQRQVRMIEPD